MFDMQELIHSALVRLPSGQHDTMFFVPPSAAEAMIAEIKRLTAIVDRITKDAEWCGWVGESAAFNVNLWRLPHCDGRNGTLLEAANAAERGE